MYDEVICVLPSTPTVIIYGLTPAAAAAAVVPVFSRLVHTGRGMDGNRCMFRCTYHRQAPPKTE